MVSLPRGALVEVQVPSPEDRVAVQRVVPPELKLTPPVGMPSPEPTEAE
jgi:hypothetical protein